MKVNLIKRVRIYKFQIRHVDIFDPKIYDFSNIMIFIRIILYSYFFNVFIRTLYTKFLRI